MVKKLFCLCLGLFLLLLSSCAGGYYDPYYNPENSEDYLEITEKDFTDSKENNKVNVSLDSSTAAYSNIRRMINNNVDIPSDSVVIEQMINYFNYSYVNDTDEALAVFTEVSDCPWNNENKLLQVAIKAKDFKIENKSKNNFVFLLDVSGSMQSDNKLPLMVEAFKLLIDNLNDDDRVSIVTYAGDDSVLLDGGFGYERNKVSAIISDLEANGSTHGSEGIKTAYEIASKHFIEGGNNRVFLATDGDFNVGISSTAGLKDFISRERNKGIYLSLFGFGEGNLKSSTMDTLAQNGNGNYYYIDSILEAKKVFVSELGGTLNTVAKDTKCQVEFNTDIVEKYRVIGYENRMLTNEEFDDSETDAGEIGASHTTVCLIELVMKEKQGEFLTCTLRYKEPETDINKEVIKAHSTVTATPSNDFIFASSVAEFGLLLRNSLYKADASYESVVSRINNDYFRSDPYKDEFYKLVLKVMDR